MFKKISKLLSLGLIVLGAVSFFGSSALFLDVDQDVQAQIQSAILDLEVTPSSRIVDDLIPDQSQNFDLNLTNAGNTPFKYSQAAQNISADPLCSELDLTVKLGAEQKFVGKLADYILNNLGLDLSLQLLPTQDQSLTYEVSLPTQADESLANSSCQLELLSSAWQADSLTPSSGFSDDELVSLTINTGSWATASQALGGPVELSTPTILGWDSPTNSLNPSELPVDFTCGAISNTGNKNHPQLSLLWDANDNDEIWFERELTNPNGESTSDFFAGTNTNFHDLGFYWGMQGNWQARVRAFRDANSNSQLDEGEEVTNWSDSCNFNLDIIYPSSQLQVTNSPTSWVVEQFPNGSFESWTEFDFWSSFEDTQREIITGGDDLDGDGVWDVTVPEDMGQKMAKLGVSADPGQNISYNILGTTIPQGTRSFAFYYNFFTFDELGFDEPGMMVFVNDEQVMQLWAEDLESEEPAPAGWRSTGWKKMNIYLPDIQGGDLNIVFYSGNTDMSLDPEDKNYTNQSWLYLDGVSSQDLVVQTGAKFDFSLRHDEGGSDSHLYYQINDETPVEGDSFILNETEFAGVIKYWAQDEAGNTEPTHVVPTIIDNQAPEAVTDLEAFNDGFGEFTLSFTAPFDNLFEQASKYDLRYSSAPITSSTDWESLPQPDLLPDDNFAGTLRAPRLAGTSEILRVENLVEGEKYYFALKARDAANNWSSLSNIAAVNDPDSEIVLNEILYNPQGNESDLSSPYKEWVELYNNGDTDLDLTGWYLQDSASNIWVISEDNSDNDGNLATGETIIPAGAWLTVYQAAGAIWNNGGDTVSLFNSDDVLIDSHEYSGSKAEGFTEARDVDGTGTWVDPLPTPGRANIIDPANLIPSVKLWRLEDNKLKLSLFDSLNYESAEYLLTYGYVRGEEELAEALAGNLEINSQMRVDVDEIYLGTCSGEDCTPHEQVENLQVEVKLIDVNGEELIINYKLE